jgi:hypothetical protein
MVVNGQIHAPAVLPSKKEPQIPIYRRLGEIYILVSSAISFVAFTSTIYIWWNSKKSNLRL